MRTTLPGTRCHTLRSRACAPPRLFSDVRTCPPGGSARDGPAVGCTSKSPAPVEWQMPHQPIVTAPPRLRLHQHRHHGFVDASRVDNVHAAIEIHVQQPALRTMSTERTRSPIATSNFIALPRSPGVRQRLVAGGAFLRLRLRYRCTAAAIAARSSCSARSIAADPCQACDQ